MQDGWMVPKTKDVARTGWDSTEEGVPGLLREHRGAVLAATLRATGDRELAEEVVQETFLRAWRNPQAFRRSGASPRGWLLTVARHVLSDRWRARARRRMAEVAASGRELQDESAFDRALEAEVVRSAMARLSPEHREVLVQCVWEQRTVAEAAWAIGVPPGTVKSRTYYALRSLRLILDEMGYEP
jgi:RNA polymerase sigma-70 factor (ECF subfamily)